CNCPPPIRTFLKSSINCLQLTYNYLIDIGNNNNNDQNQYVLPFNPQHTTKAYLQMLNLNIDESQYNCQCKQLYVWCEWQPWLPWRAYCTGGTNELKRTRYRKCCTLNTTEYNNNNNEQNAPKYPFTSLHLCQTTLNNDPLDGQRVEVQSKIINQCPIRSEFVFKHNDQKNSDYDYILLVYPICCLIETIEQGSNSTVLVEAEDL
ncbi:unnamed protein product, partial [Trichobilharzia regenti]